MSAKKQVFAMLLAWCAMSIAASADTIVLVKHDNAGVYQNRIRKIFESPMFRVSTQDRLLVMETKGDRYLIRDSEGREGWIEKAVCKRALRNATITYDPIELTAFHPEVNPIWISGDPLKPDDRIYLDRSFKEELRSNTDKESVERQVVAQ
jgi:hypothetical protein